MGKGGANTFIKQHISCHSLDGLSSLVKTIPVQASQSSKVNKKSRRGWDIQLGCSQVLSVFSYYFLLDTHTVFFFIFFLVRFVSFHVSVWGVAARDPSTSPWLSQQDISRLDTADRVSKHPVCVGLFLPDMWEAENESTRVKGI